MSCVPNHEPPSQPLKPQTACNGPALWHDSLATPCRADARQVEPQLINERKVKGTLPPRQAVLRICQLTCRAGLEEGSARLWSKFDAHCFRFPTKRDLSRWPRSLAAAGVELISTGGTAKALREAGLNVTDLSAYTGFPEMLDGRVKTLHPKVHGGLLYIRGNAKHEAAVRAHGIQPIDLVVVNLYPFEQTVARPNVSLAGSHREHRHRRPVHAAQRGQESRERHRGRGPGRL